MQLLLSVLNAQSVVLDLTCKLILTKYGFHTEVSQQNCLSTSQNLLPIHLSNLLIVLNTSDMIILLVISVMILIY